jgi:hypothetical protein
MRVQSDDQRSDVVAGEPLRHWRQAHSYINSSAYFMADLREQSRSLLVFNSKERRIAGIPEIVLREVGGCRPPGRSRGRMPSEVLRSLTTHPMPFRHVAAALDLL